MTRIFAVFIVLCFVLGACTQRHICPAFQSAFIYDKSEVRKKFSYFENDSLPKILTASKTKYLIAEPVTYKEKLRSLNTVDMISIHPVVPDSLQEKEESEEDFGLAERDTTATAPNPNPQDSTGVAEYDNLSDTAQTAPIDSVYVITKDKEVNLLKFNADSVKYSVAEVKYNTDQDNYLWYLRDVLVLPDVRLAQMQKGEKKGESGKNGTKEKKGGFFKNLFKKKKKAESDSLNVESENIAAIDTATTEKKIRQKKVKVKKEKKKRKKEEEQPDPADRPMNEEPLIKEEDTDGGF